MGSEIRNHGYSNLRARERRVPMIAVLTPTVMSDPAWIVKWRAREALKNGRPEEAHRLLDELLAAGNRRAFALRADVVQGYLDRAQKALRQEDVESAWA